MTRKLFAMIILITMFGKIDASRLKQDPGNINALSKVRGQAYKNLGCDYSRVMRMAINSNDIFITKGLSNPGTKTRKFLDGVIELLVIDKYQAL